MKYRKIMIFGRPGSGKSTWAYGLSKRTGIPLYHLDKYFFTQGWKERPLDEFMDLQQELVQKPCWIIDGNSIHSLQTRWSMADVVLYFNFSRRVCLFRLIKRVFYKPAYIDDRAENCPEVLRFRLIKYMWTFEKRVNANIKRLKAMYPHVTFIEINTTRDLLRIEETFL